MKKIMISVAILIAQNGFSQMTETKKLASGKTANWKIVMNIKNGTDTVTYFYYGYQNAKYTHITDIGAICTQDKQELIDISNALKTLSEKEKGVQVELNINKYSLRLYDFSNNIYIEDEEGKYTYVTKKQAVKMADEFLANAKFLRK
jgi:hypothetical protein